MADIIINGQTYNGVETITTQTTGGGTATFSEGEDMKVQTFDLPFSLRSGSDDTYTTIWDITDATAISNLLSLITEKSNSNTLISISLKYAGIETPYIVSSINSPFTDNVGFLSYVENGNGLSPIYYVLTLHSNPYLRVHHQGIPSANIQAILNSIASLQVVVKYME